MKLQVLGTGCAKCNSLYAEAQRALAQSGVTAQLLKIESIDEIAQFEVLFPPALAIDGQVKCSGRVPKADEIAAWLKEAAASE